MTTIAERRAAAAAFCEYATNGETGRKCSDPVYQAIVEKRDKGPGYSSCGDLAHWLLTRLGCRDTRLNRKELYGFVYGVNVSRLSGWLGADPRNPVIQAWPKSGLTQEDNESATKFRARVDADHYARCLRTLQRGDICITWTKPDTADAHVCVFDRCESGLIHTWDLGQGPMSKAAWSGGKDLIEADRRHRTPAQFAIKRFIPLDRVPFAANPEPTP
jgi:hypothetical protein